MTDFPLIMSERLAMELFSCVWVCWLVGWQVCWRWGLCSTFPSCPTHFLSVGFTDIFFICKAFCFLSTVAAYSFIYLCLFVSQTGVLVIYCLLLVRGSINWQQCWWVIMLGEKQSRIPSCVCVSWIVVKYTYGWSLRPVEILQKIKILLSQAICLHAQSFNLMLNMFFSIY